MRASMTCVTACAFVICSSLLLFTSTTHAQVYTPTKDDVGHVLKVKVYAGNEERPATDESHCKTAESKFAVSVIDEPCLYESIPGVNYFCKNKKG